MKKESLETGNELQKKLVVVKERITSLSCTGKTAGIEIRIDGANTVVVRDKSVSYTDKTNTNLEYLNQLYRDNVLRTLENCKIELEREFELLGKNDSECSEEED